MFVHDKEFQPMLGKIVKRPAKLDRKLVKELRALAHPDDPYETVTGKTMCTSDFYEGNFIIRTYLTVSNPVSVGCDIYLKISK